MFICNDINYNNDNICLGMLMNKDREILELKGNIAELLAVMPANASIGHSAAPGNMLLRSLSHITNVHDLLAFIPTSYIHFPFSIMVTK